MDNLEIYIKGIERFEAHGIRAEVEIEMPGATVTVEVLVEQGSDASFRDIELAVLAETHERLTELLKIPVARLLRLYEQRVSAPD